MKRYIPLGDVISKATAERCGGRQLPILSITMKDGLVLQDEKFKKRIASADTADYKVIPRGKLVQGIHIDEANFGIQDIVDEGIVSPAYKVWDINSSVIFPKYLEMIMRSPRSLSFYRSKLNGSVNRRGRMTDDDFLAMPIPIDDYEQQKKIVSIICKALGVIESYNRQLLALDILIKARFVEMFGDETNPYNWPIINVEDIATVTVGVVIKPAQYYTAAGYGVKAFRSLNIGEMYIKDNDWVYFTQEGNDKNNKSQLHENDLLIIRSGAPGVACVVTKQYEGCNAIDIIIARPNTDMIDPYYLCMYTNMPHGKRQIEEGTGGAAQQHFNVGKYNKLRLMLPPIEKQKQFSDFIAQVDKSKSVIQAALAKDQLLFDSLMQKYFG